MRRDNQTLAPIAIGNVSAIDFGGSRTDVTCQLQVPDGNTEKGQAVKCRSGYQFSFSFL